MSKESGFLKLNLLLVKTLQTVEMAAKDLEYYRILVDKKAVCFKRNDSNFERSSTLGKILSNSIDATDKSFLNRRVY